MKDRSISGFGPTKFTVTNSTGVVTGAWIPFGPFNAAYFGAQITFGTATSGALGKIQAALTTATTAATTLISQTGDQTGVYKHSTFTTGVFTHIRLWSTSPGAATSVSNAITAYVGALG